MFAVPPVCFGQFGAAAGSGKRRERGNVFGEINRKNSGYIISLAILFLLAWGTGAAAAGAPLLPATMTKADFAFDFVKLNDEFDTVKDRVKPALVEAKRVFLAYDGRYHSTWKNERVEIEVIEGADRFYVNRVRVFDGQYVTSRGVRVGDLADAATQAYGKPHHVVTTDTDARWLYNTEGTFNPFINNLVFVIDPSSGKITGILLFDAMAE